MNKMLAIAIPTYNRSDILRENIIIMLPKIKKYQIPIYISDDSNNDDTNKMLLSLMKEYDYSLIFYKKNKPSLGHDANCLATLQLPVTQYVWYLGDSIIIKPEGFDSILSIINSSECKPDFISVNSCHANKYPHGLVDDMHDFFCKCTWFITLSGATIYSRKVIDWVSTVNISGSYKNFMQLGVILHYAKEHTVNYYWCGDSFVYGNKKKKSYWSGSAVNVFACDWSKLIKEFSELFGENNVKNVLLSHSRNTFVFGVIHYLRLRSINSINEKSINQYKDELISTSKTPFFVVKFISHLPVFLLSYLFHFVDFLKKKIV